MTKVKLKLCPEMVILDFEAVAIDVYLFYFTLISIKLCLFNFGQNIYKKIVEKGLKVETAKTRNFKIGLNRSLLWLLFHRLKLVMHLMK